MRGMKSARIIGPDLRGVKNSTFLPRVVRSVAIIDTIDMVRARAHRRPPAQRGHLRLLATQLSSTQLGEGLTRKS